MFLSRQGVSLIIWMAIFTIIITVVVMCRFWAVRIKKRPLRPDDHMIVVAYISTLAFEGVTWWGIANGLGAHTAKLSAYEVGVQYKILLGTGFTWLFATVFCKLSILWFYTCIFSTKSFKIAAWILMVIVAAYGVSFLVVFFTNCQPLSQPWNPVPHGHCKDVTIEQITSVSANMVIDAAIVVLPMPPLWGLQLATRKKIAISLLFSLGLTVIAIMAWRIHITVQSINQIDFVYGLGNVGLAAFLEVWLGIVVACLPTLPPLLSKYLGPVWSRVTGGSAKPSRQWQPKEARRTIGGSEPRGFNRRSFNRLDKDYLLELEEGNGRGNSEAMVSSRTITEVGDGNWMKDPTVIGVRQDFHVYGEPQNK